MEKQGVRMTIILCMNVCMVHVKVRTCTCTCTCICTVEGHDSGSKASYPT